MNNLIRRTWRQQLPGFSREMNDLIDRFFADSFPGRHEGKELATLADWQPRINLKESDQEYTVQAELPGMTQDQIEVSVENNTLFLKGEKKFERKEETENYHRLETGFGTFFRAIEFPGKINAEKVAADLKHGVLTVTAAKAPEVLNSARKISIKS